MYKNDEVVGTVLWEMDTLYGHIFLIMVNGCSVDFRKVTVSDVSPEIFKLFLQFLYCGTLDMKSLSTEQIADLMVFSDQYEVKCISLRATVLAICFIE